MMNTQKNYYAGVDVSKDKLDLHWEDCLKVLTVTNTPAALAAALKKIIVPAGRELHVVCEASGGYERNVLKTCHAKDVKVSLVNASRPLWLSRSGGQMAKSDAIDAAAITRFGMVHQPVPTPCLSKDQERLKSFARRRGTLVRQRAKEKDQLQKEYDSDVKKDINSSIANLKKRIEKFDALMAAIIAGDSILKEKRERLEQIIGVGPVTTVVVLAEFPELGLLSDRQASALAGLAPFVRDSGKMKGRRMIRGGRGQIRKCLFMAATSASRHNPILKEFYDRLRAKGKAHHLAVTAVMRKLICLMNRLLADPEFVLKK